MIVMNDKLSKKEKEEIVEELSGYMVSEVLSLSDIIMHAKLSMSAYYESEQEELEKDWCLYQERMEALEDHECDNCKDDTPGKTTKMD